MYKTSNEFLENLVSKTSNEIEFHQAVKEVIDSIWDYIQENPEYLHANILDRIVEPERVIMFRVPWIDDQGKLILTDDGPSLNFGKYAGQLISEVVKTDREYIDWILEKDFGPVVKQTISKTIEDTI